MASSRFGFAAQARPDAAADMARLDEQLVQGNLGDWFPDEPPR
jgi:hypothetical protein